MILRRFMQHIKEQNWFAVGLDVIVVIVGIFLGMQVTEWNDAINDRDIEQVYLQRLLADAGNNEVDLGHLLDQFNGQIEAIEILGQALSAKSLEGFDESKIELGVYSILSYPSIRFRTGTITELLSAGKMDLIRDNEIKTLLLEQNSLYEFIMTQHRDFRLYIVDKQEQYDKHTSYQTVPNKVRPQLVFDFDELSNSREFQTIVHNVLFLQRLMLSYRSSQNELNIELIKRLKCNIEKSECGSVNNSYKRNLLVLD